MNPLALSGPEFLGFFLVMALLVAIATIVVRQVVMRAPPGVGWQPIAAWIHPTEVAFLVGGVERAVATAVAELHHRGVVTIRGGQVASAGIASGELESEGAFRGVVAPARYTALEEYVLSRLPAPMSELCSGIARTPIAGELATKLESEGLLVRRRDRARWLVWLPGLVWIALGVIKFGIGLANNRPIGHLFWLLFVGGVLFAVLARVPRLTALGARAVRELRSSSLGLEETARTAPQQLGGTEMALAFAIFGAAVAAPDLQPILPVQTTVNSSSCGSSGSSCGSGGSSGCSSGGGDSGGLSCGGGGGCGGGGCGGCSS